MLKTILKKLSKANPSILKRSPSTKLLKNAKKMDNLSNQPSPVEESIVLSDKKDRKILSEGRNYQMGFAFCKKESHGKYSTVQPISACKDYLNDVVYSEMTGKPCAAYGLSVKKENIYDEEAGYAYMVIKILPYQRSSNYPNQEKDMQNLKENYKLLEKFINYFEEKKGLPHLSQITEIDEDRFFIRVPLFWCRATSVSYTHLRAHETPEHL